jgi:hypothetical protein
VRTRTALLLGATIVGVGLLGAWRLDAQRDAAREAAAETSRIRAWAWTEGGAGVSVLPKRVPLADPRELQRLDHLPGFDSYAMRCASCHELPDPAAYAPKQWIGKVAEMREKIDRAGVMPPAEGELEAAIRFLQTAAEQLRRP